MTFAHPGHDLAFPLPVRPGERFQYMTATVEVIEANPKQGSKGTTKGLVLVKPVHFHGGVLYGKAHVVMLHELYPCLLPLMSPAQRRRLLAYTTYKMEAWRSGRMRTDLEGRALAARKTSAIRELRTLSMRLCAMDPEPPRVRIDRTKLPGKGGNPVKEDAVARVKIKDKKKPAPKAEKGKKESEDSGKSKAKTPQAPWSKPSDNAKRAAKAATACFKEWHGVTPDGDKNENHLAGRIEAAWNAKPAAKTGKTSKKGNDEEE